MWLVSRITWRFNLQEHILQYYREELLFYNCNQIITIRVLFDEITVNHYGKNSVSKSFAENIYLGYKMKLL